MDRYDVRLEKERGNLNLNGRVSIHIHPRPFTSSLSTFN